MQDIKIVIAAALDFLSLDTRQAWQVAGVELLGPFSLADFDITAASTANGVVIDIGEDSDAIFQLSENLETWKIPFLYAFGRNTLLRRKGPFIVNAVAADIRTIIDALLTQGDIGIRH